MKSQPNESSSLISPNSFKSECSQCDENKTELNDLLDMYNNLYQNFNKLKAKSSIKEESQKQQIIEQKEQLIDKRTEIIQKQITIELKEMLIQKL